MKSLFAKTFADFHDLKVTTRSLHGDKSFTVWEWIITCKWGVGENGETLKREHAPPKKIIGCTLMWWDKGDKIVKNHEYMQLKDDDG